MNTSRKDKIKNVEILCRTALPSMADILIEKNLRHVRLLGHMYGWIVQSSKQLLYMLYSLHEKLDLHQIYSVQIWCKKVQTKVK